MFVWKCVSMWPKKNLEIVLKQTAGTDSGPNTLKKVFYTIYTFYYLQKKVRERRRRQRATAGLVPPNVTLKTTEKWRRQRERACEWRASYIKKRQSVSLKGKLIVSASLILDVPKSKCRFGRPWRPSAPHHLGQK